MGGNKGVKIARSARTIHESPLLGSPKKHKKAIASRRRMGTTNREINIYFNRDGGTCQLKRTGTATKRIAPA